MTVNVVQVPNLLIAENEEFHRVILNRVFRSVGIAVQLHFVEDGQELVHYLTQTGAYTDRRKAVWPALVLVDLHMPKMGGIQALRVIRSIDLLRRVPVVICSSSNAPHHIDEAYASGANAYLTKVGDYKDLVTDLRATLMFWLRVAQLPRRGSI